MLKQIFLLSAAAAALAAAPSVAAQGYQQQGQQATTGPNGEVVTVRPTVKMRRFYMPRDAVREVSGEYLMEDGRIAKITDKARTLTIDFDNRRTQLEAVGSYVFQSAADDMTLVYTQDGLGDDMIVLSYIPLSQTASAGGTQRILLSSR